MAGWLGIIVPAQIGPVEKIELELPGTAHHELVVYHVKPGSPIVEGARLPRWARPSLVLRDGRSMHFRKAGYVRPDDYLYIFMSPEYATALDHLFAAKRAEKSGDKAYYGDFAIAGDVSLRTLVDVYGANVTPGSENLTVAGYMTARLKRPEAGDRVDLGSIELIIRELDGQNHITQVGMRFSELKKNS